MIFSKKNYNVNSRFCFKNLVLGLIPYLTLVPGFTALLLSTRVQLSVHGGFHTGYIFQILHGFSPPENVVLPGYGANIYWLYHALLAVFSYIYNIAPPLASAVVNLGGLIGALYWIRKSIGMIALNNKNSLITSFYSLLVLFGASLFGAIHVLVTNIIRGKLNLHILFYPLQYDGMLLDGDKRLLTLLKKFLNFNGTSLGILYFAFCIYISLLILKKRLTTKRILLLAIAISGALIFHTISGLFALAIIPLSLLISLIYAERKNLVDYLYNTKAIEWLFLLITCFILFAPVFHHIYLGSKALPKNSQVGTSIFYNIESILSTVYPLLPLSILGVYVKYRKLSGIILFISAVSILGYILSIILELPGDNQYKFIFSSTIAVSILSVIGLDYLYYNLKGNLRLAGKTVFYITFVILAFNIMSVGFSYLNSSKYEDTFYYTKDKEILLKDGFDKYNDVYNWIRDNTPSNTIVIMPLPTKGTVAKKEGRLHGNIFIIAQRLPYVANGLLFAKGIPEFHNRLNNIKLFYSNKTPLDKKIEILNGFKEFSNQRQSILFIPKENLNLLEPHLRDLKLIYSGKEADLYSF